MHKNAYTLITDFAKGTKCYTKNQTRHLTGATQEQNSWPTEELLGATGMVEEACPGISGTMGALLMQQLQRDFLSAVELQIQTVLRGS